MKIDKIIRSNRRTIAIIVQNDGQVLVRAPHRAPGPQIQEFVERKRGWIEEKLELVRQKQAQAAPRSFAPGETYFYLGEAYPLEISSRSSPALALKNDKFLLARQEQANARDLLERWYRKQARMVLAQRAELYAERFKDRLGTDYTKIRITSARTRWGSCSSLGTLSFPYRLVMAPLAVIDYVVVHELAHLVVKNHSKRFWDQVAAMMPDYAQHVAWLKENGYRLKLD